MDGEFTIDSQYLYVRKFFKKEYPIFVISFEEPGAGRAASPGPDIGS